MTTSEYLFNNSELSLAAYADLSSSLSTVAQKSKLILAGMSTKEADEFALRYPTVLSVYSDPTSGFQATVFQAADGQVTVAIRGTTSGLDILQDVSIILGGTAQQQLITMVNWWNRETAIEGNDLVQFTIVSDSSEPSNSVFYLGQSPPPNEDETSYLVKNTTTATADGELASNPDIQSVNVTGHSLGGYLAMAFDGLFGSSVDKTYVYNALGCADRSSTDALFAALTSGGHFPFENDASIINIAANEALPGEDPTNFAAGLHSRPGTDVDIAIEDKSLFDEGEFFGIGNHSIGNVTDSLAVYNLLEKLDSSLTVQVFNDIFHSSSNDSDTSLESIIFGIEILLGLPQTNITTDSRDPLYQAIYGIQSNPAFTSLSGVSVQSSVGITGAQAETDFSAFLSLYNLSPVYLAGANLNNSANSALYSSWEAGEFSVDELSDRADALHILLSRNMTDEADTSPDNDEILYVDYSSGQTIYSSGGINDIDTEDFRDHAQIHFGSSNADRMEGGEKNDYFYGGAGNDTYIFDLTNGGDVIGIDTIQDHNGGTLQIDGITLDNLKPISEGSSIYKDDANNDISVILNGTMLRIIRASTQEIITIEGFNKDTNNFGLTLSDAVTPIEPLFNNGGDGNNSSISSYIDGTGTTEYIGGVLHINGGLLDANQEGPWDDFWISEYGDISVGLEFDLPATMNDSIDYEAAIYYTESPLNARPDGGKVFDGRVNNDFLKGADWHALGKNSSDILSGYGGDDVIYGDWDSNTDLPSTNTGDNDLLIGGHGSDQLYGGGGNDTLYAWQELDHRQWWPTNERQFYFGNGNSLEDENESNYLDGGSGTDWLIGASFNDILIGGTGGDFIYAGSGQDMVSGGEGIDFILGDSLVDLYEARNPDFIAPDVLPEENDYERVYFYKDGDGDVQTYDPQLRYNNELHEEAKTDLTKQKEYNALFNDVIDGGSGNDSILGEIGSDVINGGAGADVLYGDRQYNSGIYSSIYSGSLLDNFQKLSAKYHGDDVIDGGAGNDKIIGGGGGDVIYGGDENPAYVNAIVFNDDTIYGDLGVGVYDITNIQSDRAAVAANQTQWWGNDTIFGGKGNDFLLGEGGNDVIYGGDDNDLIYGDWKTVSGYISSSDYSTYGGADELNGGAGSDTIYGGAGNDILTGGTGSDTLYGDSGNDTYIIGSGDGNDTIDDTQGDNILIATASSLDIERSGSMVTIYTSSNHSHYVQMTEDSYTTFTFQNSNGGNLAINESIVSGGNIHISSSASEFTLHNSEIAMGLQLGQTQAELSSSQLSVVFNGLAAEITIGKTDGNSVIINVDNWNNLSRLQDADGNQLGFTLDEFAAQDGVITGLTGNDTITGGTENETLRGEYGHDILSGGQGNDTLDGGYGNDTLNGGDGSDLLNGGDGYDTLSGGQGDDTLDGGYEDDALNGGDGIDLLYGGYGNDALNGGDGTDLLNGGDGDDRYFVDNADDIVTENIDEGTDFIESSVSYTLGSNIENLTLVGSDDINGVGNDLDNIIIGNDYDNIIDGGHGWDYLAGGAGDDIYIIDDDSDDAVIEYGNEGIDLVRTNSNRTLDENIENLTLIGTADFNGIGNELDNVIEGNSGSNILNGGAGNDTLDGGSGDDILIGGAGSNTYVFGRGYGSDEIDNFEGLNSIRFTADVSEEDIIFSRNGNDLYITIIGSDDRLTIYGAFGFEGAENPLDKLIFTDGSETALDFSDIRDAIPLIAATENDDEIYGTESNDVIDGLGGEDYLLGHDGDDTLYGGTDNDELNGGSGNDTLDGGSGIDQADYISALSAVAVDLSNTSAQDTGGAGIDTLIGIENLLGSEYNDTLTGDSGDNWLFGNDGDDTLSGGAGNDRLYDYAGDNTLNGGAGNDMLTGGSGDDTLNGGDGSDTFVFWEGSGVDVISSSDSSDIIQIYADPADVYISKDGLDYLIQYKDNNADSIRIVGASGVNAINFFDNAGNPVLDGNGDPITWTLDSAVGLVTDNVLTISAAASESGGTSDGYFLMDKNRLLDNDGLSAEDGWDVVDARVLNDSITGQFYFGEFYGSQVIAFQTQAAGTATLQYFVQRNGSGPIYAQTIAVNMVDAVGGVVTLDGTTGIDLIDAMDAEHTILDGKEGNDYISGGFGDDIILHRFGDGNDVIDMRDTGYSQDALILMGKNGAPVDEGDVTFEQDGMDLLIHLNNGIDNETLQVEGYFQDSHGGGIGSVKLFADVNSYNAWKTDPVTNEENLLKEWIPDADELKPDAIALRNNVNQMITTDGDDKITNWIGDSQTWQSTLDNTVDGLSGNDIINTKDGDDILIGGLGNDTLAGGSGNDTYRFAVGDGQDIINNFDINANNDTIETGGTPTDDTDILEITGVTDYRDLWLHQNNDDLVISVLGTSDEITVKDWFAVDDDTNDEHELDVIRVTDVTGTWDLTNHQDSVALTDNFDRLIQAMSDFGTTPSAGWHETRDNQAETDLNTAMLSAWS